MYDFISIQRIQSGINKDLEDAGGTTVHQSIDVRWLSIIESLRSILKSFKVIKKILQGKQQQRLLLHVEEKTIKQIILLLKPFKHVIKLIQTGNSPSLHMVLLCAQTLRDVMSSYQSLLKYDENYGDAEQRDRVYEPDEDLTDELEGKVKFLTCMLVTKLHLLLQESISFGTEFMVFLMKCSRSTFDITQRHYYIRSIDH